MRKLYGSTSWRRVLALVLVFVMMFSVMGTSGYSVFAESEPTDTQEEVIAAEPEVVDQEVTEDIQGPSPGEEEAEAIVEPVEEAEEDEADVEAVEEATEEAEEPAEEAVEEAVEDEEAEEPAEEAEAVEEDEAEAEEPAEESEEEPAEEVEAGEGEDTLIAEAAQAIIEDDGSEAPAEEAEEVAEEAVEEAEEEAIEELPEEEVIPEGPTSFAPKRFGDTTVTVTAEPYTFPEGTTVSIEEVFLGRTQKAAIADAVEEKIVSFKAYDITFFDADGIEIQPAIPVKVSIVSDAIAESDNLQVVHMEDEKSAEVVDIDVTEDGLEFDAEHFSVYVVVETGSDARLIVNFACGTKTTTDEEGESVTEDNIIASIYVKSGDIPEGTNAIDPVVLYDPGVDEDSLEYVFKGWTREKNYTTDTTPLTIDGVRSDVAGLVPPANDGDSVTYYAMLFTSHSVVYQSDDEKPIIVSSDTFLIPAYLENGESAYTVNANYTVDDKHNFEGWMALDEDSQNHIKGYPNGAKTETISTDAGTQTITYYENGTNITVTGDITFTVRCPEGTWLIFNENGKSATYTAPQFILKGNTTTKPSTYENMTRNGYSFDDWYYGVYQTTTDEEGNEVYVLDGDGNKILIVDEKGNADLTGATPFNFGQTLPETTTIYANWIPNNEANYMIVFWTQNEDRTGYEVEGSYVNKGQVGTSIPFTPVDNRDEDYATGAFGDGQLAETATTNSGENPSYYGVPGHYRGFCLNRNEDGSLYKSVPDENGNPTTTIEVPTITPEGDAVLNLYYDRIVYNFKFYLYRTDDDQYQAANDSGNGRNLDTLVTWNGARNNHPIVTFDPEVYPYIEGDDSYNGESYHYFALQAYYGQEISEVWPTYDMMTWEGGYDPVSYVMMVGTALKPTTTNQGSGTVKGIISVLNANILGATNDANGNYVIVRFPAQGFHNWRYHIWLETVDGEDYSEKTTRTYTIGDVERTYYEETVMEVRSSNTQVSSQNEPKYTGFDFKLKRGDNTAHTAFSNTETSWQVAGENDTYHLNYIYNRQQYPITYFDGNYVDGNGVTLQNRASNILHESDVIGQGATISDEYKNYIPDSENVDESVELEKGYVFEGWYLDEGCTEPYVWSKMPVGGIAVYAKWRQIQYRTFLHTNVPTSDTSLTWGTDQQHLSFRISYGGKVSTPTGLRDGYKFLGWYTDSTFKTVFNSTAFVLNEETVTTPYDKSEMTDPENSPWEIDSSAEDAYNSDLYAKDDEGNLIPRDRFWITKKLDLYAKWSKVLDGADGINVVYDAGEGSNAPKDDAIYLDSVDVTAGAAATAPTGKVFDHWVVGTWSEQAGEYTYDDTDAKRHVLPGEAFEIKADDAKIEPKDENNDGIVDTDNDGNVKNKYTVSLLAIYVEPEEKTPTHINWYKNDGEPAFHVDNIDDSLSINEGVDIQSAPERTGYIFLGWAKVTPPDKIEDSYYTQSLTKDDLFLEYHEAADGEDPYFTATVKKNGADTVITALQVAADEREPYDDLFAVWEADNVDYTVRFYYQGEDGEYIEDTDLKYTDQAKTDSTVSVTDDDKAQTKDGKYTLVTGSPSVLSDKVAANGGTVLKLYFDQKKVDVTVHHYLKGTTTKVADDTTEQKAVGSTIDPATVAEAETFLDAFAEFDLTKDSTDPTTTVTVTANGAEITLYYTLPLTITAEDKNKKYDGDPLIGEYTIDGALASDESTIKTALGDAPSIKDVGTKDYLTKADQADITGIPGYYVVTYVPGRLTISEAEPQKYTILYNANYSTYSEDYTVDTDPAKLDGPATSLNILSPADEKLGFAEKAGDDLIWTTEDGTKYRFVGWFTDREKKTEEYEINSLFPKAAASADEGGTNTVQPGENQTVEPDTTATPAESTSAISTSARRVRAMVATTADGADLTLYAQWEMVLEPHLTVTKETTSTPPNGSYYEAGEAITYTITVTNDGNVEIKDIVVEDMLEVELAENNSFEISSVAPGESKTITVTYTVTEEDAAQNKKVVNEATAHAPDPTYEPEDPDDPDPEVPEVPVEPGKTDGDPTGKPNDNPGPRPRPTPTEEEPDEVIPEDDTPLAPYEEDPEEEIPADDTPFAPYEEEPDEEVAEEPTPFSPYTGDDRHTAVWGLVSLLSLAGIAVVARKRREEE